MTRNIEGHRFPVNLPQIQIRNEKLLAVEHWIKHILSIRTDDRPASPFDLLPVAELKCRAIMKFA